MITCDQSGYDIRSFHCGLLTMNLYIDKYCVIPNLIIKKAHKLFDNLMMTYAPFGDFKIVIDAIIEPDQGGFLGAVIINCEDEFSTDFLVHSDGAFGCLYQCVHYATDDLIDEYFCQEMNVDDDDDEGEEYCIPDPPPTLLTWNDDAIDPNIKKRLKEIWNRKRN